MNKWWVAVLCACVPWAVTPAAEESVEGLAPYEPGDGVTVVLRGVLTREWFKVESVRIVGARLAGRAADPDQFRMRLLDAEGRTLGLVSTWSPLLSFEWGEEGEFARHHEERIVDLHVPASLAIDSITLGWSDGAEIARVSVGAQIREFCELQPQNPGCEAKKASVGRF